MLYPQELRDSIIHHLARFQVEIQVHNEEGRTDINLFAEKVIAPILSELLRCNLRNLNKPGKVQPAIDLGDIEKGIAVQVTSRSDARKIADTVDTFIRHELYKTYKTLYVFSLTTGKKNYAPLKVDLNTPVTGFHFSTTEHVINIDYVKDE